MTDAQRPQTLGGQDFPVENLDAALPELRRPFTPEAIRWKVQATWPKGEPTKALIVPFVDARLVYERLNLVVGAAWFATYEEVGGDKFMWCRLTVFEQERRDVGQQMLNLKGLVSDAVKRAAIPFGVGTSLYVIPKIVLEKKDGHLRPVTQNNKPSLAFDFDGKGESRCREIYSGWLDDHGKAAFGEPLSHGDVAGAVGDVDAETEVSQSASAEVSEIVTGEEADELRSEIVKRKVELHRMKGGRKRLPPSEFGLKMQEANTSIEGLRTLLGEVNAAVEAQAAENEGAGDAG